MKYCVLLVASLVVWPLWSQSPPGNKYKPIVMDSTYHHTKWGIAPSDLLYHFAAYTSSFDSDDDDNGDGVGDLLAIPEWVAYEVKEKLGPDIPTYTRPTWMTDDSLAAIKKAPTDKTYAVSGTRNLREVSGDYRYVRGHMCPKDVADRMSMFAGFNTHTVLNAVPQLQWQNNGLWKALESQVTDWADQYGSVWVICGPIFFNKTPAVWLGQDDEVQAAVPDAIFKIVIRETEDGISTLTFIIPNVLPKQKKQYYQFLTSMNRVEELTGLSFLTNVDPLVQIIEKALNLDFTTGQKRRKVNRW